MREREEARCSGRADGGKERGRERKSDGRGETERVEKLMSRPLCDGACLFQCQPAFPHTHLKTSFSFPFPQSSPLSLFKLPLSSLCLSFLLFLSQIQFTALVRLYITERQTNRLPKCNFDTTFFFYTLELQRMIWFESSGKVIRSHSC